MRGFDKTSNCGDVDSLYTKIASSPSTRNLVMIPLGARSAALEQRFRCHRVRLVPVVARSPASMLQRAALAFAFASLHKACSLPSVASIEPIEIPSRWRPLICNRMGNWLAPQYGEQVLAPQNSLESGQLISDDHLDCLALNQPRGVILWKGEASSSRRSTCSCVWEVGNGEKKSEFSREARIVSARDVKAALNFRQ